MSDFAAIIKNLVGQVFATSLDGLKRQVFEGERIFQGEQLTTALGGSVTLQLVGGEQIDIGEGSNWQAGLAVADEQTQASDEPTSDLEQAIAAGFDPTAELEPTAAGPGATGGAGGAAGGGHSFVLLDETAQQLDPTVGFNTQGLDSVGTNQAEELGVESATSFTDTTPPAPPSISLIIDSGSSGSDAITNNGAYSVGGIESGATVEYSTDGSTWSTTAPTAVEGSNTIQVRQTDIAGNVSAPASLTFTLDTLVDAPVISLTTDSGSSGSDAITNNGAYSVGGIEPGATVEYSTDGSTWSTTAPTAVEGSNTIQVRQTDIAGNVSAPASLTFTLDTLVDAPVISLTTDSGSSGSDAITNNGAYSVGGIEPGATVEYSTDGSTWSTTAPTAVEGSNTIQVRQTDIAGNVSAPASLTFTLDTLVDAPVISLDSDTGSSGSDAITNNGAYSVGGIEPGATVEYSTDGSTWSTTAPTAVEGSNTIQVRQTDIAGNVSAPASLTFTLDTTAPVPTISLDADITADDIINASEAGQTIAITGTVGGDAKVGDTVTL
ncbi:retention module-containing protein, partial [Pseudomonas zhanjiangensis]